MLLSAGCASQRPISLHSTSTSRKATELPGVPKPVSLVSHQADSRYDRAEGEQRRVISNRQQPDSGRNSTISADDRQPAPADAALPESLVDLELLAVSSNPGLRRIEQEASAALAKVRHVDKLPDPTLGANIFVEPIETASGSQRANLTVAQMLPWLARLDAMARQACLEAVALQQVYLAERLRVVGELRAMWYRLYVIERQIETNEASQRLLSALVDVANARVRVAAGTAAQDVLAGILELSKLEEQLVTLRQQRSTTKAAINRLVGRDASTPIDGPTRVDRHLPDWSHPMLRQLAWENQPAIAEARIRTQATRWGMEVARFQRRPNVSFSASWFAIDDNRPFSGIVDVGEDAWSVGASMSIPLWHGKYDAIEREASWKHAAAHASVDETELRFDAVLRDLWAQAQAASQTATLYETTIVPQARQVLDTDQQSYSGGHVEFDRVMRDFRNLLTLELGYHRAVGQLATALARIRQATGTELADGTSASSPPEPLEIPDIGQVGPLSGEGNRRSEENGAMLSQELGE